MWSLVVVDERVDPGAVPVRFSQLPGDTRERKVGTRSQGPIHVVTRGCGREVGSRGRSNSPEVREKERL